MTVKVFAPAKVNLTLHVTGQRDDGYHLIDSLVAFAPVGDDLEISDAPISSLTVEGPEAAGVPADVDNLVMKVAEIMAPGRGFAMTLHKNLPSAAGIGGGSADAAAAIRALMGDVDQVELERLEGLSEDKIRAEFGSTLGKVVDLGADIAVCVAPTWQRVRGIGGICEVLDFPALPVLLVNPRVAVPTPAVFKALKQKENAPMQDTIPPFKGIPDFSDWLVCQRNDLQAPALKICPEIGEVLDALAGLEGCLLARMSGSGATCFAIFETPELLRSGSLKIGKKHPDWWRSAGWLGNWIERSVPKFS